MSGLSDVDLDRIEAGIEHTPDPDKIALVGEVRRLRTGIRAHREAAYDELACCDACARHGKQVGASYERRLWALLADQETPDV